MLTPVTIVRPAAPDDDLALAELINHAGEGMPVYLWDKIREPGETAWDVGCRRARREGGGFSYRNAIVAEDGDRVVAALVGYPLPDAPEEIDPETMPGMFVPLQELENRATASWYVNVLAAYPAHRGRGIGTQLLQVAEDGATALGHRELSIIVSDGNPGARRLYERFGFVERASRPMVKDDWKNSGQNWVLLVKAL